MENQQNQKEKVSKRRQVGKGKVSTQEQVSVETDGRAGASDAALSGSTLLRPSVLESAVLRRAGSASSLLSQISTQSEPAHGTRPVLGLEGAITQVKQLLRKIRAAMLKQPNVSADIKTSVPLLEEAFDVIADCTRGVGRSSTSTMLGTPSTPNPAEVTRKKKRPQTSPPAESETNASKLKRKKTDENGEWSTVVRKTKSKKGGPKKDQEGATNRQTANAPASTQARKRSKRSKPPGVLVKPPPGTTYAQVVGQIRGELITRAEEVGVTAIRSTRDGNVLLELSGGSVEKRKALSVMLKEKVGDTGVVKELVPRSSVEVMDLDCCTSKDEVTAALTSLLGQVPDTLVVNVTKPNKRGQVVAIITAEPDAIAKLLETGRLRVGFISGRVRIRTDVKRCYKCLGYGHESRGCIGRDRSNACFKCGADSHKAAACTAEPSCFLCADKGIASGKCGHVAGSGSCQVFREALAKEKGTLKK